MAEIHFKLHPDTLDDMLIALSEVSADEVSAERAQLSKEGVNFSKLDDGIKSILTQPKVQKLFIHTGNDTRAIARLPIQQRTKKASG